MSPHEPSSGFSSEDIPPPFNYLNREAPIDRFESTFLPHWLQGGTLYFVTFRLVDSLPQEKLALWERERKEWLKDRPEPHDSATRSEYFRLFPKRRQAWLDQGYGSMILRKPEVREIVESALLYFSGDRYYLDEFVVAANHVHVLIAPSAGYDLSQILHSWKSFSAKQILNLEGMADLFPNRQIWQRESWDHIVRSENSLERFRRYIRGHSVD